MRRQVTKKIIQFFLVLSMVGLNLPSWAEENTTANPNAPTSQPSPNTTPTPPSNLSELTAGQSKVLDFARQAGVIAGMAQACNQNTSVFNQRILIALKKLAANPTELAGAILIYQQVTQSTQASQKKSLVIPCHKVLDDYRQLPILQADYQSNVIDQLTP
jgi:hypothetical protein